ncbi:MAG TPA: SHOCT domain-containing protein [Candidatus Acidoferrum sp.]|nr:SHOCT domain-containing protein [Candidatus Acidoferrum sp.]
MLLQGGFSFANFSMDLLLVFVFVVWFWLLITVFDDLFRRQEIPGWSKALWIIVVLLTGYSGVLIYMILQGKGMAERNAARAQQARDEIRSAIGFSVSDEIEKLERLKKSGSITGDEFGRLRAKLVQ